MSSVKFLTTLGLAVVSAASAKKEVSRLNLGRQTFDRRMANVVSDADILRMKQMKGDEAFETLYRWLDSPLKQKERAFLGGAKPQFVDTSDSAADMHAGTYWTDYKEPTPTEPAVPEEDHRTLLEKAHDLAVFLAAEAGYETLKRDEAWAFKTEGSEITKGEEGYLLVHEVQEQEEADRKYHESHMVTNPEDYYYTDDEGNLIGRGDGHYLDRPDVMAQAYKNIKQKKVEENVKMLKALAAQHRHELPVVEEPKVVHDSLCAQLKNEKDDDPLGIYFKESNTADNTRSRLQSIKNYEIIFQNASKAKDMRTRLQNLTPMQVCRAMAALERGNVEGANEYDLVRAKDHVKILLGEQEYIDSGLSTTISFGKSTKWCENWLLVLKQRSVKLVQKRIAQGAKIGGVALLAAATVSTGGAALGLQVGGSLIFAAASTAVKHAKDDKKDADLIFGAIMRETAVKAPFLVAGATLGPVGAHWVEHHLVHVAGEAAAVAAEKVVHHAIDIFAEVAADAAEMKVLHEKDLCNIHTAYHLLDAGKEAVELHLDLVFNGGNRTMLDTAQE